MASLRFLQANLDHTRIATAHLVSFMRSQNIDLAIVSDPYTRGATVPDIPYRWYRFHHDQTPRCLIISPNPSFDIFPLHVSPYITAVTLNAPALSILFIGVYAAPSVALDHILTVLSDILSRHTFANVVIAGDFNARNTLWGGEVTNTRGRQLAQFSHSHQLRILNNPDSLPTFETQYAGTWIDVTMAAGAAWSSGTFWEVRDTPTLSDHRYILFGLEEATNTRQKRLTKPSEHRLVQELLMDEWLNNATPNVLASSLELEDTVNTFYHKFPSLKRKYERAPKNHRGNAWWTDAIAKERSFVKWLRRRYQTCRDPLLRADLKFHYYHCLHKYKEHIQAAKEDAIKKMNTIASRKNLFGIPFKTAFKKILFALRIAPIILIR